MSDRTKVINYGDDTIHRTESELVTWSKDDSHELQLNASYDFSDHDLLTFSGQYSYCREREFQEGNTMYGTKRITRFNLMFLKMRIRIERSNGREKLIIRSRSGKKKEGFSLLRMV